MWTDVWKRWMDMIFWWLPKPQETKAEDQGASQPGPQPTSPREDAETQPEAARQAAEPARTEAPAATGGAEPAPAGPAPASGAPSGETGSDDLTTIKGIGPAMQDKLRALGLNTYRDLAAADPEALTRQLKASQRTITSDKVQGWIEAARERT